MVTGKVRYPPLHLYAFLAEIRFFLKAIDSFPFQIIILLTSIEFAIKIHIINWNALMALPAVDLLPAGPSLEPLGSWLADSVAVVTPKLGWVEGFACRVAVLGDLKSKIDLPKGLALYERGPSKKRKELNSLNFENHW